MGGITLIAEFVVIGSVNVCSIAILCGLLAPTQVEHAWTLAQQAPLVTLFFITGLGYLTGVLSHACAKNAFESLSYPIRRDLLIEYWEALDKKLLESLIPLARCKRLLSMSLEALKARLNDESRTPQVKEEDKKAAYDLLRVAGHGAYALSTESSQAALRHRSVARLLRGVFWPLVILATLLPIWVLMAHGSIKIGVGLEILVIVLAILSHWKYCDRYERFWQSRIMSFLVYQNSRKTVG